MSNSRLSLKRWSGKKLPRALYTSAAEMIREALRLLDEQDRLHAAKLDQVRQDIQNGLASGPATPWDREEIKGEGRMRRGAGP